MNNLEEVMTKEVSILREMLANLAEEEQGILMNEPETIKRVIEAREPILGEMMELRAQRNALSGTHTSIEITSLTEQIAELLKKTERQTESNQYLIEKRIGFTRSMIDQLAPKPANQTYSPFGSFPKQTKVKTKTLINREV